MRAVIFVMLISGLAYGQPVETDTPTIYYLPQGAVLIPVEPSGNLGIARQTPPGAYINQKALEGFQEPLTGTITASFLVGAATGILVTLGLVLYFGGK